MTFNPNELVIEKVRAVEEYDPDTKELVGRYTQIESPSIKTTAGSKEVTDAMGAVVAEFFDAQKGTFSFSNSLFSLDLAASQFAADKVKGTTDDKITVPVSETIAIGTNSAVVLKYVPVGTEGAEVKFVKVINSDNTFGDTYEVSSTAAAGKFTLDADTKTITLPTGTTGKVFVNYNRETENAILVTKSTDSTPTVKSLLIHVLFHNVCNQNTVYAGIISCPRALPDITSVDLNLSQDGKHAANYKLQKEYCDEAAKLFDIIVAEE